jgi:hypothetical protein
MKRFFTLLVTTAIVFISHAQSPITNIVQARRYFQKRLIYPQEVVEQNRTGIEVVEFTVLKDGQVRAPTMILSQNIQLSQITMDIVRKSSGLWSGWTKDSINIILPIYFGLDDRARRPDPPFNAGRPLYLQGTIVMEMIEVICTTTY